MLAWMRADWGAGFGVGVIAGMGMALLSRVAAAKRLARDVIRRSQQRSNSAPGLR